MEGTIDFGLIIVLSYRLLLNNLKTLEIADRRFTNTRWGFTEFIQKAI
jgi:hypothetical protein